MQFFKFPQRLTSLNVRTMWWGERVRSSATAIIISVTGSLRILKPYLVFSLFLTCINFQIFKYDAYEFPNQHFSNIHILVTTTKKYTVLNETFTFIPHTSSLPFQDQLGSVPLVISCWIILNVWSFLAKMWVVLGLHVIAETKTSVGQTMIPQNVRNQYMILSPHNFERPTTI